MMEKLGRTGRGVLVLGLLILMQLANVLLVGRLAPVGIVLVALYCLFVLWIWVRREWGTSFCYLIDSLARPYGPTKKKRLSWSVGGCCLDSPCLPPDC